jgi:hypothetical protein
VHSTTCVTSTINSPTASHVRSPHPPTQSVSARERRLRFGVQHDRGDDEGFECSHFLRSPEEVSEVLNQFELYLADRTKHHLGYPYNLEFQGEVLAPFLQFSINNLGAFVCALSCRGARAALSAERVPQILCGRRSYEICTFSLALLSDELPLAVAGASSPAPTILHMLEGCAVEMPSGGFRSGGSCIRRKGGTGFLGAVAGANAVVGAAVLLSGSTVQLNRATTPKPLCDRRPIRRVKLRGSLAQV